MSVSRIAAVEIIPVVTPGVNAADLDGASDTVIVRVTDEDGRAGIGEADAPGELVKAFVEMPDLHLWSRGIRGLLLGRDPFELRALWEEAYEATSYPGRRGLGIHALSAVDMALHDLVGKQLGRPIYQLLGGARREHLTPYATIFPGLPQGRAIGEVMAEIGRLFETALSAGFRAVKMEVLFFDLVTDAELVELIHQGRRMLGDGVTMMLDFGYRWHDWRAALWVLDRVEDCNVYFA
jgi:L-alanine-DL-glutamate epimerase-like enolase superfamily enzyme